MSIKRALGWTATALGMMATAMIAGCSGGDSVTRYLTLQDAQNAYVCERCPEISGGTTEVCNMLYEDARATAEEEACLHEVYAMYAAELDPAIDCQYEAEVEYDRCVRAAIVTCPPDEAEYSACRNARTEAFGACPVSPSEASMALGDCYR